MLDIKRIIDDKANVRKALLKRMDPDKLDLDKLIEVYNARKQAQQEFEKLRSEQNAFNQEMAKLQKGSPEFKEHITKLKELAAAVKEAEAKANELTEQFNELMSALPNIPDDDVVAGEKEANEDLRFWGEKPQFDFEIKDHLELGESLGLIDLAAAAKIGGAQMPMYKGDGARLEWALIQFFIDQHYADGYEMILPPHLLTEQTGYAAGQLPKFRDDVYWTQDNTFLLPTAETALAGLFMNETLDEKDLPYKAFAYTPCYRREAGGYRANERGLLRMHQFNKVEMFQFTTPEQSDAAFEELVAKAEDLMQKLGLYHKVVKLAAGDCSAGAARTYDVEVYLPYLDRFQEVSSVSNVRDYQARRANTRYKPADGGKPQYIHTLNGSGLATSRLMVGLLEQYQNADGTITVPEVLRPYMGKDKIG